MKTKQWLWILIVIVLVAVVIFTAICLTKCSNDDPRKTSIVLTKEETSSELYVHYDAEVLNGKNGQTYVFKSKANEHLANLYVIQSESEAPIEPDKYELKMYNKDYKEIQITYDATRNTITLTNEEDLWYTVYKNEDIYFTIMLKLDTSFKLKLQTKYV